MSGAEAVPILFSGAAMDTQTVNRYDGARRDFPCVWSRGSPHTLFRRRKGHPDPRTVMCLEQRPSACSFQAPQWTPRPERHITPTFAFDGMHNPDLCFCSRGCITPTF